MGRMGRGQYLNELDHTFRQVFDISMMQSGIANMHAPLQLTDPDKVKLFEDDALWGKQKLHYLFKVPGDPMWHTKTLMREIPELYRFIQLCQSETLVSQSCDLLIDRYGYVTVDTRMARAGESQREGGWHIDCVQGDEVPVKQPGNIAYSWCDALPTEYAHQTFLMAGCDISKHNIFRWAAHQVKDENIKEIVPGALTLMNTYCVHRAKVAEVNTPRRYVRISWTHCPITNSRADINPDIEYPYEPHSTEGEIPCHLK